MSEVTYSPGAQLYALTKDVKFYTAARGVNVGRWLVTGFVAWGLWKLSTR